MVNDVLKPARHGIGPLSARMLLGETSTIKLRNCSCQSDSGATSRATLGKGCIFEDRIVQKHARSRMHELPLGLIDYPCRVEAVGLYEHQSRRRGVLDRKNQFAVPCALHGWITGSSPLSSLGKACPSSINGSVTNRSSSAAT